MRDWKARVPVWICTRPDDLTDELMHILVHMAIDRGNN
jgi:hypothetical protein